MKPQQHGENGLYHTGRGFQQPHPRFPFLVAVSLTTYRRQPSAQAAPGLYPVLETGSGESSPGVYPRSIPSRAHEEEVTVNGPKR